MKITASSRKFRTLIVALAIVITLGLSLRAAHAGYIVSLQQVGPNVVATGSGTLDLTGLTFGGAGVGVKLRNIGLVRPNEQSAGGLRQINLLS